MCIRDRTSSAAYCGMRQNEDGDNKKIDKQKQQIQKQKKREIKTNCCKQQSIHLARDKSNQRSLQSMQNLFNYRLINSSFSNQPFSASTKSRFTEHLKTTITKIEDRYMCPSQKTSTDFFCLSIFTCFPFLLLPLRQTSSCQPPCPPLLLLLFDPLLSHHRVYLIQLLLQPFHYCLLRFRCSLR
eukprot:TRINITY_DN11484_c0_g1_i4.p2 TRINITY_DN11484_c0_g1~~TRINITY_DN11484_c0_g1_i4.p2  ORF type:complete len:204 (+),score=20.09 TRINITY_DN11484_c0_g1_i4:62-613(+)